MMQMDQFSKTMCVSNMSQTKNNVKHNICIILWPYCRFQLCDFLIYSAVAFYVNLKCDIKNINKISLYAQSLKWCKFIPMRKLVLNYAVFRNASLIQNVTILYSVLSIYTFRQTSWPPLWSSGQSFWLQIQRSRVRFPALPYFLKK
jgi:hypothetical protein